MPGPLPCPQHPPSLSPPSGQGVEVFEASIPNLQEAMADGRTAVQLVDACLARISAYDQDGPVLNSMVYLNPNARAQAAAPVSVRILVPIPALSVLLALERAVLLQARNTRPITVATSIEITSIAVLFLALGWGFDLIGVTSAFLAFLGGGGTIGERSLPGAKFG